MPGTDGHIQKLGRVKERLYAEPQGELDPSDTLILEFKPPEVKQKSEFLLF